MGLRRGEPSTLGLLGGLEAALAASGTGTWHWDARTGVVRWDETLEALSGLEPGTFGGTFDAWMDTLHPDDRPDILGLVQSAFDERSAYRFEHRTLWPDGTVRWIECRGEVVLDDTGAPCGTVGCATDVTARKLAELEQQALLDDARASAERLQSLQHIGHRLASALEVDDVVRAVMEDLDAPEGATTRALWLLDPDRPVLHLADQHGMPDGAAARFEHLDLDADLPGALAVRDRRTVVSTSSVESLERFTGLAGTPRSLEGFVAVPLVVEDEALGVLAFGSEGTVRARDLSFLEAAGAHVAQTLRRVRLAEAVRQRADEIAFLAEMTRAAVSAPDHRALMRSIATTAVHRLGDICSIHFVPEPGADVEVVVVHADPGRARWADQMARAFPYDPTGERGVAGVLTSGRSEIVRAETAVAVDGAEVSRAITVPIVNGDRVMGAFQVLATDAVSEHGESDVELALGIAASIGTALEERWMTDQHRHISASLQRAFLPPRLPHVDGLDVASAYWPAGAANVVGGDFYDMYVIGEHRWALTIGDACGGGPDAAAVAAIARHTGRAAARHGHGHHEVLEWVNQAVLHSDRDLFCTACYATMQLHPSGVGATLTLAAAGHPPAMVISRHGGARPVGRPGTLLGVFDHIRTTLDEVVLEPGDAVVLYSDGITDLPPPYGLDEQGLAEVLGGLPEGFTAQDVVDHVRADLDARIPHHRRADDVAVLVIRLEPQGGLSGSE